MGECARRGQAAHPGADYNGLPANERWHYRSSLTMPGDVICTRPVA